MGLASGEKRSAACDRFIKTAVGNPWRKRTHRLFTCRRSSPAQDLRCGPFPKHSPSKDELLLRVRPDMVQKAQLCGRSQRLDAPPREAGTRSDRRAPGVNTQEASNRGVSLTTRLAEQAGPHANTPECFPPCINVIRDIVGHGSTKVVSTGLDVGAAPAAIVHANEVGALRCMDWQRIERHTIDGRPLYDFMQRALGIRDLRRRVGRASPGRVVRPDRNAPGHSRWPNSR